MCIPVLVGAGKVVRNGIGVFRQGHIESLDQQARGHAFFGKQQVHLEGVGALRVGVRGEGVIL